MKTIEDFKNQIILGDCLEVMKDIPDQSIDMILCDLPYGTTACKWDVIIPFDKLWEQYTRITKDDAAIVLTAAQPFTSVLVSSNLKMFRYEWIWEKPQGTNPLNAKVMPMKSHENILIFSKKRAKYFPQMEEGKPYSGFSSKDGATIGEVYANQKSIHRENHGTRYPKTIRRFKQEKGLHPTQKPVELFEYLIRTHSEEGDLVLDNCIGSGTTAIAAINSKRNYIGIEMEDKYYRITNERINTVLSNTTLDDFLDKK
jgi:site-specific DNA-methyltransferase (adenine-specific)